MDFTDLVSGNPLIQRFGRSRLRAQPAWASAVVVLIVCGCVLWAALEFPRTDCTVHVIILLSLQAVILSVAGSAEIAAGLAQARDSGALDFHRISPQRPLAIATGFILGTPVREWMLAACTVPVYFYCVARTPAGLHGGLLILVMLCLSALLHHCLAALAGILTARARNAAANAVGLVFLLHVAGPLALGVFTVIPTASQLLAPSEAQTVLNELNTALSFMGAELPAALMSLLHQLPALLFALIALVRRIHLDVATPFSRPQAIAAQAVFTFLLVADVWGAKTLNDIGRLGALIAVGGSALLALALSAALTPGVGQIARGVRRSSKLGLADLPPLDDRAPNLVLSLALAIIVAVAGLSLTLTHHSTNPAPLGGSTWGLAGDVLPPLLAALLVLHFAAALQFFTIRSGRHGPTMAGLYYFLAWLVPLPLAGLVAISLDGNGHADWVPLTISSLSHPVAVGLCGLVPAADDLHAWTYIPGIALNAILTVVWLVLSANDSLRVVALARREPLAGVPAEPAPPSVPPPAVQGPAA